MIFSSALIIWKGLMLFSGSESPVVVVLSESMEPGFQRVSHIRSIFSQYFLPPFMQKLFTSLDIIYRCVHSSQFPFPPKNSPIPSTFIQIYKQSSKNPKIFTEVRNRYFTMCKFNIFNFI